MCILRSQGSHNTNLCVTSRGGIVCNLQGRYCVSPPGEVLCVTSRGGIVCHLQGMYCVSPPGEGRATNTVASVCHLQGKVHLTPSLISFIEGSVTMVKSVTLWSLNRSERIRL